MVLDEELFEEKQANGNLLEEGLFELLEEEKSEEEIKKWIDDFMSMPDLSSHISHEGKKVYRTYGTRAYYYLMCDKLGLTPRKETAYQAEAENDDFELNYAEGDVNLVFKNDKYFKEALEESAKERVTKDNISTLKPGDVLVDGSNAYVISFMYKEGTADRPTYKLTLRDLKDGRPIYSQRGSECYGMKIERAEETEREIDPKYISGKKVVEEAPLDESKLVEGAKSFLRDLGKDNIQYFTLYNRFNYTTNQLRVDNENKTYEKGEFVVGSKGYTTHNGAEFKRLVAELEDRGYTEVKNESLKEEVVEELSEFEKKAKDTAEKLGIEIRLRGNDRFDLETLDREKLEKFYRELLGVEMGEVQGLKEEMTPNEEKNIGLATLINGLIEDEIQAVDGYKSAIVTFETEGRGEFTDVFRDIMDEENRHIGQLQEVLNVLSPGTQENIDDGQTEAQGQISGEEATTETPEEEIKVEIE